MIWEKRKTVLFLYKGKQHRGVAEMREKWVISILYYKRWGMKNHHCKDS